MKKTDKPDELSRIGVAIGAELLNQFDHLIEHRGYASRSEALRDLIRADLVQEATRSPDSLVVGSLTLLYNHHVRQLSDRLTEVQHQEHHLIRSTLHVHLDHDNCLESIIMQGKASEVEHLANVLLSTKGVKHGKLMIIGLGSN